MVFENNSGCIRSGVVEDISYTIGGAGNQWVTIDGIRYATFFDAIKLPCLRIGCRVEFRSKGPLLLTMVPRVTTENSAEILRVLDAPRQVFKSMISAAREQLAVKDWQGGLDAIYEAEKIAYKLGDYDLAARCREAVGEIQRGKVPGWVELGSCEKTQTLGKSAKD